MPDDNVSPAAPSPPTPDPGTGDDILALVTNASRVFARDTAFDPDDPPWGDDFVGSEFAANYVRQQAQIRDTVAAFAASVSNGIGPLRAR